MNGTGFANMASAVMTEKSVIAARFESAMTESKDVENSVRCVHWHTVKNLFEAASSRTHPSVDQESSVAFQY